MLQFNKMVFSYLFALLCAQDITISVLLISVSVVLIYLSMRKPRGIPPGPATTLPIIGDLPLLIDGDVLNTFRKLRQKHGDIFSFYFGKDLAIVINGYDKIQQAAMKNGDLFSGRPRNLFSTIAANGKGILFSEGQFWKRQRKFTNSCLQEFGFGKTSLEDKISKWRFAAVPMMTQHRTVVYWLCSFVIFQRFRSSISKKPYNFVIFQGEGVRTPVSPHLLIRAW